MTLRGDIQTALRGVVDAFGESWSYRRRISPAGQAESFGSWTTFTAHITARRVDQVYDENGQMTKRVVRARLRVSDALSDLLPGDQVRDPDSKVWSIGNDAAIESSGVGTIAYTIERDIPVRAGDARGANL